SHLSPEAALDQLRRIQQHTISINSAAPISGISAIHQDQAAIFSALKTNKPSANPQLSLL
ncbi:MAG: IS1634 family transposase, partial [Burkholderiales bacterium]